jgi:hypothetical protein
MRIVIESNQLSFVSPVKWPLFFITSTLSLRLASTDDGSPVKKSNAAAIDTSERPGNKFAIMILPLSTRYVGFDCHQSAP